MYEEHLTQAGLTKEQAQVYQAMVQYGAAPAGLIYRRTPLKRALAYKILGELINLGLAEKREEAGAVAVFHPLHPSHLANLLTERQKTLEAAHKSLEGVLPQLVSDFNLVSGKPGVRFFEGENGVRQVIDDSLTAKGEIYSYIDNEAANKYFPLVNKEYVKRRAKLGIKKKILALDTPYLQEHKSSYNREITDIRLLDGEWPALSTAVQIYNNKVSYITLSDKGMIGVIIEDAIIANLHKTLFEYTWSKAKPLWVEVAAGQPSDL